MHRILSQLFLAERVAKELEANIFKDSKYEGGFFISMEMLGQKSKKNRDWLNKTFGYRKAFTSISSSFLYSFAMPSVMILFWVLLLFWAPLALGIDGGNDQNIVVVDSWGGIFQDAQRKAIFEPFTNETGIKVVELSDGENIFAKVKAQVEMNNPQIDVIHADASWLGRGKKDGLLSQIDYDIVNTTGVYKDVIDPYGVGILYWSDNIVYNTKNFAKSHPSTWKEFWEWAISKGPIAFNGGRPNHGIEAALMAKNYSINEIYPLTKDKIDKALDNLDKIKFKTKWYIEGGQCQQLFADQEVTLGEFFSCDAFMLMDKGIPINVEWNQGIYTRDYLLVPKNAPHKENAMKLIDFAIRPKHQAKLAELTYNGPINSMAFQFIDDQRILKRLPSYPENRNRMLLFDHEWWGEHEEELLEQWNIMLSK
jgi:putative spermidine/putrescine transport system substrate-binding protein